MMQAEIEDAVTDAVLAQLARHLENADSALATGDPLRASAEVGNAQLVLSALARRITAVRA